MRRCIFRFVPIPKYKSQAVDSSDGRNCAMNQSRPVWFPAGKDGLSAILDFCTYLTDNFQDRAWTNQMYKKCNDGAVLNAIKEYRSSHSQTRRMLDTK
jgi:hypothetical protein